MTSENESNINTPQGDLVVRTWCMPSDTNPSGDMFGGWLLAQMDIAGAMTCRRIAKTRTATVAIDKTEFHLPVYVGDILCCYTNVERIGNTSIRLRIEAWVTRQFSDERLKVTEGIFTYVAIDENRKPQKVKVS